MKYLSITFTICCLLFQVGAQAQTDSFIVGGVYRNYTVHLPTGYNSSTQHPLVLNLHGYTSNAAQQQIYTSMDASADANGYIVVYPNGLNMFWNSWAPPGGVYADDVAFLSQLIDTLSTHYTVNPKRVYSCGMSNGGYMSYTLACTIADRLAAIASVAGTMSNYTYSTCTPARKIPVMHIHGTTDPTVPYNTGAANSIGVEQTIAFWRDTDACQNISDTINLPNTSTSDNSTVQTIHYQHCALGNDVLFYKITGGGHTWPGGVIDIPQYGNTNRDISATNEIWKFFTRYTLDGPVATGIADIVNAPAITVYPDPATHMLTISDTQVLSAEVYDATGRTVLRSALSNTLDVSSLQSGIYVVKINSDKDKIRITKFVKQSPD